MTQYLASPLRTQFLTTHRLEVLSFLYTAKSGDEANEEGSAVKPVEEDNEKKCCKACGRLEVFQNLHSVNLRYHSTGFRGTNIAS